MVGFLLTLLFFATMLAWMCAGFYILYACWYKENPHLFKPPSKYFGGMSRKVYDLYGTKGLKIQLSIGGISFIIAPIWIIIWVFFIFNH